MTAQRFTKKPVTIEAVQYDGTNADTIRAWMYPHVQQVNNPAVWFHEDTQHTVLEEHPAVVWDYLHKTWVGVSVGQWIIRGVKDEFYPCDDAVLQETYTPAEAQA